MPRIYKHDVPPLVERQRPPLSATLALQLRGIHPHYCANCTATDGDIGVFMQRWLEADEWDRFSEKSPVIILCQRCAKKLIDPHPRLYRMLMPNEPRAGSMELCVACVFREGTRCTNVRAKSNGGPGVEVLQAPPITGFVDGRGFHGPFTTYPEPPHDCDGRALDGSTTNGETDATH